MVVHREETYSLVRAIMCGISDRGVDAPWQGNRIAYSLERMDASGGIKTVFERQAKGLHRARRKIRHVKLPSMVCIFQE